MTGWAPISNLAISRELRHSTAATVERTLLAAAIAALGRAVVLRPSATLQVVRNRADRELNSIDHFGGPIPFERGGTW